MSKFKNFAINHPFGFGLTFIIIFPILSTLAWPIHYLFPDTIIGQTYGDALVKVVIFVIFVLLLRRFGWIKASRINAVGSLKTWAIAAVICIYLVFAEVFVFSGDLSFPISDPKLALSNLVLSLSTGLVEETMYRAIVLVAMITAWGGTKRGQVKAILLSSLFFGINHLANLMIRPAGVVIMQAVIVTLPGVFYAALVLSRRTLWPAVIIHGLTNAAVNIKVSQIEGFTETAGMWLGFVLVLVPVLAYAAWLIWRLPDSYQNDLVKGARIQYPDQKPAVEIPAG